jgi:RimJ/RimL family protein N-acetyltransferase
VGTYIGGPRPRDELERAVPEVPRRRPGLFVVGLDGAMIGMITLDRRDAERPGHVRADAAEAELGYLFLPEAWGCGYAAGVRAGTRLVRRRASQRAGGT